MEVNNIQIMATVLFILAIIHSFLTSHIQKFSERFEKKSIRERLFYYLGQVEVVFGLWAALLMFFYSYFRGFNLNWIAGYDTHGAVYFLENQDFTEPLFVFVIICMAVTKPITVYAQRLILLVSKLIPLPGEMRVYLTVLVVGPLLGSLITQPAAMAVTASVLMSFFYSKNKSEKFMYLTIALLFVNVSMGGTLTNFSAPPVIVVAQKWGWDIDFMLSTFGYKSILAILISTTVVTYMLRKELGAKLDIDKRDRGKNEPPLWLCFMHLVFIALSVIFSDHTILLVALFIFFMGFVGITVKYQSRLIYKESLLVAFFLSGLMILGSLQDWWLKPLMANMSDLNIYLGTTVLTSFTDNTALCYLGSLVELSETAKYSLVAGAMVGGGLTIIANAPNPVAYSMLKPYFKKGFSHVSLFKAAILPTLISFFVFLFL